MGLEPVEPYRLADLTRAYARETPLLGSLHECCWDPNMCGKPTGKTQVPTELDGTVVGQNPEQKKHYQVMLYNDHVAWMDDMGRRHVLPNSKSEVIAMALEYFKQKHKRADDLIAHLQKSA